MAPTVGLVFSLTIIIMASYTLASRSKRIKQRLDSLEEDLGRRLDEFKDDLKALSIDLKTVLNEISFNKTKLQERAQEHTEIKDQLLQIENQILQIKEQRNQSLEIAELKNELIQLNETCKERRATSTFEKETSALKAEACTCNSMTESSTENDKRFESCLELYKNGHHVKGQYDLYPDGRSDPIRVFCDQETDGGGWTVFQRRKDGSEDFYRNWTEYKHGFGDLDGEFWLGNDYLSFMTTRSCSQLRIELKNTNRKHRYAMYNEFQIKSASENYMLKIGRYSGNVGFDALAGNNGQQFTTKDVDNDPWGHSCATLEKGAWWYNLYCSYCNLNGRYSHLNWRNFDAYDTLLTFTEMKFRRLD